MEWLGLVGSFGVISFHTFHFPSLLQAPPTLDSSGKSQLLSAKCPYLFAVPVIPRDPSLFLRAVWQGLHAAGSSAAAPAHPHRREALQVPRLRQDLHRHVHPAPACGGRTPHHGIFPALSATFSLPVPPWQQECPGLGRGCARDEFQGRVVSPHLKAAIFSQTLWDFAPAARQLPLVAASPVTSQP